MTCYARFKVDTIYLIKNMKIKFLLRGTFRLGKIMILLISVMMLHGCRKPVMDPEPLNGRITQPETKKRMGLMDFGKRMDRDEARTYVQKRLDNFGKVIASLSRNKNVRRIVNESVAKRFDGDYNVLLKDLYPQLKNLKSASPAMKTQSIGNRIMEEDHPIEGDLEEFAILLTEPFEVNGETLYPQIYIPFSVFEVPEIDDPDPCASYPPDPVNFPYPVIVPYDGVETESLSGAVQDMAFEGYTYDTGGILEECPVVDECFAKRHTVWAITLNETNDEVNTDVIGSPAANATQAAYIQYMKLKVSKESWIKGKSEVSIYYRYSWVNGIDPADNAFKAWNMIIYRGLYNINYISLGSFTRREVRRETNLNLDRDYLVIGLPTSFVQDGGGFNTMRNYYPLKGDYIYYGIFEYDSWVYGTYTTPLVSTVNSQGNSTLNIEVASGNSPYALGAIRISPVPEPNANAADCTNQYWIANSQIEFNTLRRY